MKASQVCLDLIRQFEGCYLRPYLCPAKVWTVGMGSVLYPEQLRLPLDRRLQFPLKPEHFRVFTLEECYELLYRDLRKFERGVDRYVTVQLTQNQFDALVSFAYNLGLGTFQRSTLRKKLNRGDYEGAANELLKYNKAAGKVLRGLVRRRQAERALFLR